MMVHFINLIFSVVFGSRTGTDQCAWYFTSILIDTTFGVLVNWLLLKCLQSTLTGDGHKNLRSGNYFRKEEGLDKWNIDYAAWFKQTLIWLAIFATVIPIFLTKPLDESDSHYNADNLPRLLDPGGLGISRHVTTPLIKKQVLHQNRSPNIHSHLLPLSDEHFPGKFPSINLPSLLSKT